MSQQNVPAGHADPAGNGAGAAEPGGKDGPVAPLPVGLVAAVRARAYRHAADGAPVLRAPIEILMQLPRDTATLHDIQLALDVIRPRPAGHHENGA